MLLSGADFVFTTSFHATAVAIIFEKQFNVFLPNNAKRITDMLDLLDLGTKLVSPGGKPDYGKIDYSQVTGKKYEKIKTSKEYINMAVARMWKYNKQRIIEYVKNSEFGKEYCYKYIMSIIGGVITICKQDGFYTYAWGRVFGRKRSVYKYNIHAFIGGIGSWNSNNI